MNPSNAVKDVDPATSAPTQGGAQPRAPPGTGTSAGTDDEGKRLRPKLIHTSTYHETASKREGISLVDYPDSPGSDSFSPVPVQAPPVVGPGVVWAEQTPEKTGSLELDPDFPAQEQESELGMSKEGMDSGFKSGGKSAKIRSLFGKRSPISSPDMFRDSSSPDPNRTTEVGSDSDSDLIPNSLVQANSQPRVPILKLPRLSSSSNPPESSQVGMGRKRKGSKVVLSSSSNSSSGSVASDSEKEVGRVPERDNSGSSDSERGCDEGPKSFRAKGAETMPEVYPKGWVGPESGSHDLTNDSLKDFKISRKLKGNMTNLEKRQTRNLQNFEKGQKNQDFSYKNPKNPKHPKLVVPKLTKEVAKRGGGSGRGKPGNPRTRSTRPHKPNEGTSYAELMKTGFNFGGSNSNKTSNKKKTSSTVPPKNPPWIPSGSAKGDFPPLKPRSRKEATKDVDTVKTLEVVKDNSLKPSPRAGPVGTSKRAPIMLPESIYPQKPPQGPQRLKKSESPLALSKKPSASSATLKKNGANPPEGQKKCETSVPQRAGPSSSPSSKPTSSATLAGGKEKGKVAPPLKITQKQ